MKLLDKETKAGFKWSTVHDGFSIHDCNYAIPSNFGLDFWLGFQTLSCAARQDPILQVCNWTSLTQKDIQSENGVEQDKKSA